MKQKINQYAFYMLLVVASAGALSFYLSSILIPIISSNWGLNSVIMALIVIGVFWTFVQIDRLKKEVVWLDAAEKGRIEQVKIAPNVLNPLASLLNESNYNGLLTPMAARSLLSSIEDRLYATRDVPRYLAGILIFLGLLGTFWGLSQTIGSITSLIESLEISNAEAFQAIKAGLRGPLGGMGTAFSCSMLGLSGSLLLGLLDLQYGKIANVFYQYIEEKISVVTRVGIRDEASHSSAAYSNSLMEQMLELTNKLHQQIRHNEESRAAVVKLVGQLSEELNRISHSTQEHQGIMKKIAQNQLDIQNHFVNMLKNNSQSEQIEILQKISRHADVAFHKIIEEMIEGRQSITHEMRQEVRLLARALSTNKTEAA